LGDKKNELLLPVLLVEGENHQRRNQTRKYLQRKERRESIVGNSPERKTTEGTIFCRTRGTDLVVAARVIVVK